MDAAVNAADATDASLFSGDRAERRTIGRERLVSGLDYLLEGGWLAGVIVLPLIFSPNLVQIFGVPKAAFLWSLAMAMSVVFLIKAAVAGAPRSAAGVTPSGSGAYSTAWRLPWATDAAPKGAPLIGAALTFGLVFALATLASVAQDVSWWGAYGSFSGLFTVVSLLVIFALVATHLRTRRQVEWLLLAIVWASVPFLRFGAAQKFQFSPLPWSADITPAQVFSPAGDALATGVYLAMIVPLAFYLAVSARAIEFRLIYLLLALAQLAVLAVTGFAGSWIGVAAGLFALALLLRGALGTATSRRLGTLGAVVVVIVALVGAGLYARAQDSSWKPTGWLGTAATGARARSASLDYRRNVWQGTWDLSLQRPVLGWGPDTFTSTFGRTAPLALQADTALGAQHPAQTFNLPLQILQGSGVLGLLGWLATLVAFFGVAIALLRRAGTTRDGHALTAGLVAAMVAYLVTTLTTNPGLPSLLLSWVLLGIAAALAGPLWDHLAIAPVASDPVLVADTNVALLEAADATLQPPGSSLEAMRGSAASGTDRTIDRLVTAAPAPEPAALATTPISTDPWRNLGALLALLALVVYLVPVQPLGLFWSAVQHVRADAWSHDGSNAETNADYQKAARAHGLAYAAAPFQPQYALNAGRGLLQELANSSPQPPRRQVLATLAESEADLRAGLRLNPWDTALSAQLARLLGMWSSLTGKDRFAEARAVIDQTENQHPNDVGFVTDWAQTAQQMGHVNESIRAYQHLAALSPNDPQAHLQAATSLGSMADAALQSQQPDYATAGPAAAAGLAEARKALALGPKDPAATALQVAALSYKYAQVVVATAKSQKDPKAVKAVRQMLDDHKKALSYRPGDLTTAENGIKAALFLGDQRAAYLLAKDALSHNPKNSDLTAFIKSLPASVKK